MRPWILCFALSISLNAELLVYEGFNYPLVGKFAGIGFAAAWQAGGFNAGSHENYHLAADTLTFGDLRTSGQSLSTVALSGDMGGVFRKFSRPIGANGTVVYLSFLLRPEGKLNAGNSNGYFGICLHSKKSDEVFVGKGGGGAVSHYVLETRGGEGQVSSGVEAVAGQTALLVVKAEFLAGPDRFTLFVNPTPGSPEPRGGVVKKDIDAGIVDGIAIYSTGAFSIDEIRLGTTFADVTPGRTPVSASNPEPINPCAGKPDSGKLTVEARGYSRFEKAKTAEGFLTLPVSINGKSATYIFDTGAGISAICESEAQRMGLTMQGASTAVSLTGRKLRGRTGLADRLTIGGFRLRNVAFWVFPDNQIKDWPAPNRGAIGMPVLLALETLRWGADGTVEIGFPSESKDAAETNLCLGDGNTVFVSAGFGAMKLNFHLDTGADGTMVYPAFASQFPNLISEAGNKGSYRLQGVGKDARTDSVTVPELVLRVGGLDTRLAPAHVLLKRARDDRSFGNLGMDLLNQAQKVTLDFKALRLVLE